MTSSVSSGQQSFLISNQNSPCSSRLDSPPASLESSLLNESRRVGRLRHIKELQKQMRTEIENEDPGLATSRQFVGFCENMHKEFRRCQSYIEPFLQLMKEVFEIVRTILMENESSKSFRGKHLFIKKIKAHLKLLSAKDRVTTGYIKNLHNSVDTLHAKKHYKKHF